MNFRIAIDYDIAVMRSSDAVGECRIHVARRIGIFIIFALHVNINIAVHGNGRILCLIGRTDNAEGLFAAAAHLG